MFFPLRDGRSFFILILFVKIFIGHINKALSISGRGRAPCSVNAICLPNNAGGGLKSRLRNLKMDFLDVERRGLSLAHNYEFAKRLSSFIDPFRRRNGRENKRLRLTAGSSGNAR